MMNTTLPRRKFFKNLVKLAPGLRYLSIESVNNIDPSFMKHIFQLRKTNRIVQNQEKLNVSVPKVNQVSCGEKSLRYYESKV